MIVSRRHQLLASVSGRIIQAAAGASARLNSYEGQAKRKLAALLESGAASA